MNGIALISIRLATLLKKWKPTWLNWNCLITKSNCHVLVCILYILLCPIWTWVARPSITMFYRLMASLFEKGKRDSIADMSCQMSCCNTKFEVHFSKLSLQQVWIKVPGKLAKDIYFTLSASNLFTTFCWETYRFWIVVHLTSMRSDAKNRNYP